MPTFPFVTADVFTDRPFGGNPVAVFPNGRGLTERQMQLVAREFNLSETVFVLPPDRPEHTRQLRIFTPAAELPFAGHPTLGAAYVLAAIGEVALQGNQTDIVFEEGVGPVPVRIVAVDDRPVFAQLSVARLPDRGPQPPAASELAAMLSLEPSDFAAEPPEVWSCGVPFTFVALAGLDPLRRARLRRDVWESVLAASAAPAAFMFCRETEREASDIHARMFAPDMGIAEDPATGAAAAALAGYLGSRADRSDRTLRWIVEQGFEMGRPSILEVEADVRNGDTVAVRVGGASVLISRGEMEIPTDV
ncbi:MAG: PhzF family phenazine biosynthesis protein [Rhodospirillales bacterium]|nr:PhzF family phenazine biosynthesis protein [Rhodospirillales bacterium]